MTSAFPVQISGSSPNRVGDFCRFSLPSFVRRGRGGRGSRQPLRSLFEHPSRFVTTSAVWCRSPSGLSACPRLARGLGLYPTYPPLTKGRDDRREASRKPGHFSHGEKSTTLFSREPFRKLLTKIYPLTWEKTQNLGVYSTYFKIQGRQGGVELRNSQETLRTSPTSPPSRGYLPSAPPSKELPPSPSPLPPNGGRGK